MVFIMKKISAVGMLLLTVLLVLPVAAAEGKSNTHQIHAVAGGNCMVYVSYGLTQLDPALTSESEFIIASEGESGHSPTIRTSRVSAKWSMVEDGETVDYELEMSVRTREETLVTQLVTGGLYGDWPGTYRSAIKIEKLDVEGVVTVDGQSYPLSEPDVGNLYMYMNKRPNWGWGPFWNHYVQLYFRWRPVNPNTPQIKEAQYFSVQFLWNAGSSPSLLQLTPCRVQIRQR